MRFSGRGCPAPKRCLRIQGTRTTWLPTWGLGVDGIGIMPFKRASGLKA